MNRFKQLLGGIVTTAFLSTIVIAPPASFAQDEKTHTKGTSHAAAPAAVKGNGHTSHATPRTQQRTLPKAQSRATITTPRAVTRTHAATTTTPRGEAKTHAHIAAPAKGHLAITGPKVAAPMHATTISAMQASRLRSESQGRLDEIARTSPRITHLAMKRIDIDRIRVKHTALRNATFLTGTLVRRSPSLIVVREANGMEVPIVTRTVFINQTVLVPGNVVVLPVQYISNGYVLMPAFDRDDFDEAENLPAVAPCALNDGDADDAGDPTAYAPRGACLINDADGDDGFTLPPLPAAFAPATLPAYFTSAYVPMVAAGFIVAHTGNNVVLMTPNFTPMVVNASAASTNGPLTLGRYVTVYGYDVNNTLIATSFT